MKFLTLSTFLSASLFATTGWTAEWALRLPFVLLGIAGVWAVHELVRRTVGRAAGNKPTAVTSELHRHYGTAMVPDSSRFLVGAFRRAVALSPENPEFGTVSGSIAGRMPCFSP